MENTIIRRGELNNSQQSSGERNMQFLTFTVGRELYGFSVEYVKEVIEYCKIYKIPRVPEYISGVMNLRGEVLPVISLSSLFYGKTTEISDSTSIMFVEVKHDNETLIVGAVIDSVEAVVDIIESDIDESPSFGTNINSEFIQSIGKMGDRFVIILDISNVFDIDILSRFGDHLKSE